MLERRHLVAVLVPVSDCPTDNMSRIGKKRVQGRLDVAVPQHLVAPSSSQRTPEQPRKSDTNEWQIQPHEDVGVLGKHLAGRTVLPFRDPRVGGNKSTDIGKELQARSPIRPVKQCVDLCVRSSSDFGDHR